MPILVSRAPGCLAAAAMSATVGTLLDDALRLAADGLPVFPCNAQKQPVVTGGFKRATTEPDEVRRMFSHPNAALIGVPAGSASNCVVIDVDAHRGGDAWHREHEYALPKTRAHRTMHGGLHLVFAHPLGDLRIGNRANVFPGVDVRGDGGYIISPPSPGYAVVDDSPLAEMPQWLLNAILRREREERRQSAHEPGVIPDAYVRAAVDAETRDVANAIEGGRNDTLNRAAFALGQLVGALALGRREAEARLMGAALSCGLDHREAETTIRSGLDAGERQPRRIEPRKPAERHQPSGDETDANEPAESDANPEPPHGGEKKRIPNPFPLHRPLRDDESEIPTRRWVGGEGAFPRPKVVALAGAPGVSKTTLALAVAVALAAGVPFGGIVFPEAPCRVLFGVIEDEIEEIERRAHAIAMVIADAPHLRALVNQNLSIVDIADDVPFFHVSPDGTLSETDGAWRLDDTLTAVGPDISFLDPLVELHTAEESSNTLMRPVLKRLRSLAAAHDCTMVLLHHETKSGEGTALQRLRGAGAIGGVIRNLLSLRTMTADEGNELGIDEDNLDLYVKVETGKQQYARKARPRWFVTEERELANGDRAHLLMPWTPPTVTVDASTLAAALTALRRGLAGEPCSESNAAAASVLHALEAAGLPKNAHREIMRRLREAGEIEVRRWYDPVARKWRKRVWVDGNAFEGWREDAAP